MMAKSRNKSSKLNKTDIKSSNNIIVHIANLKCVVDVNPEVYSEDDKKRLSSIVNSMSKNIWIDRTYVSYKGNRFKDAFIKEDGWKEMVDLVFRTNFGKTATKGESDDLMSAILAISITYLYDIAEKFDFDLEHISIDFKKNCRFWAEYTPDYRKEWKR